MLQEKNKSLVTRAYLVAVEMDAEQPTLPEAVRMKLADGLWFMEGVGTVDVDELGKLDEYEVNVEVE